MDRQPHARDKEMVGLRLVPFVVGKILSSFFTCVISVIFFSSLTKGQQLGH